MVIEGTISLGELLEFTLFLAYIYQPLRWISTLPRRLGEVATSLIKIFEILDEKDEKEMEEYHKVNDHKFTVDGDMNIYDFFDLIDYDYGEDLTYLVYDRNNSDEIAGMIEKNYAISSERNDNMNKE